MRNIRTFITRSACALALSASISPASALPPVVLEGAEGMRPTALASADFDRDGMPDLAVGYAGVAAGAVVIHRGNVDALFPNAPEARQRRASGLLVENVFLPAPLTVYLPFCVDFLGAGDFDNDGHQDLVVGTRGEPTLHIVRGDGQGGLVPSTDVGLGGWLDTMTVGGDDRPGGVMALVVAVSTVSGSELLVYDDPRGVVFPKPETIPIPAAASVLTLARVRGTPFLDVIAAAGDELFIVEGRDRRRPLAGSRENRASPVRIHRLALPSSIAAIACGDFLPELDTREGLAIVTTTGRLVLLHLQDARGTLTLKRVGSEQKFAPGTTILSSRLSGRAAQELLVFEPGDRPVRVMSVRHRLDSNGGEEMPLEIDLSGLESWSYPNVTGRPRAVLPMRLNADARPDLVLLQEGRQGPILAVTAPQAVITVNSDLDDVTAANGLCTLREAINNANANADTTGGDCAAGDGLDTIAFAIGGGGSVATIVATSGFAITDSVTIDGTTQGCVGPPCVELSGGGVRLEGAGTNVVRGLVINRYPGTGISVSTSGNIIEGNRIGTDSTGMLDRGNGAGIVLRYEEASYNSIGGNVPAARNLVSGNDFYGIALEGYSYPNYPDPPIESRPSNCAILGNYVGVNATGSGAIPNQTGISLSSTGQFNSVGDNVVSGNSYDGILIEDTGFNYHYIMDNYVGVDAVGTSAIPNGSGLSLVQARETTIAGNVISGNYGDGIAIRGSNTNEVSGNHIGVDITGAVAIGNGGAGIRVQDLFAANDTFDNRISGNAIAGNGWLGIDLLWDGTVTPNDSGDDDIGPNNLQNFPEISSAEVSPDGTMVVDGVLDTEFLVPWYTVEFFSSESCDASGHGQGQRFLGECLVDSGRFTCFVAPAKAGEVVTATARDGYGGLFSWGSTSEFSACVVASCSSLAVFGPTVFAQDRDHLAWAESADVRWVKGDLSRVGSYATLADGELLGASGLDITADVPAAGTGLYYLVRPLICGSWQTTIGGQPGRDSNLP